MNFSSKQLEVINRPFRDNSLEVWEGTPRSGKTTAGIFRFAEFVLKCPTRDFLVLAYSQEQAYSLIIDGDGNGLKHIFAYNGVTHKTQNGNCFIIDHPGVHKTIYYKGAGKKGDYKQFQGRGFGGVYFCEVNLLDRDTVIEATRRTIASPLRVHFADLNPPSPHHWVVDWFDEQKAIWTHWTMGDNPCLTQERIRAISDSLKKSNAYLYQRDVLGLRTMPEGLIYGMWDDAENMADGLPKDEDIAEMWFSADGGVDHATSVIAFLTTQTRVPQGKQWIVRPRHCGVCYMADEYYYSGAESGNKAMSLQAKEIKAFVDKMKKRYSKSWSHFFVDPACLALSEELKLLGIEAEKADNNHREGVNAGIERIQDLILRRRLKLLNDDAKHGNNHGFFLKELNAYAWGTDGNPVKMHDDAMDAMRYGVNYYLKTYGGGNYGDEL